VFEVAVFAALQKTLRIEAQKHLPESIFCKAGALHGLLV
jgi:hypothetical protein